MIVLCKLCGRDVKVGGSPRGDVYCSGCGGGARLPTRTFGGWKFKPKGPTTGEYRFSELQDRSDGEKDDKPIRIKDAENEPE